MAIEAQGLEIQIGARTLLHPTDFHVSKGDKIGLVGRNGAGKTTLTRVITGEMLPAGGKVAIRPQTRSSRVRFFSTCCSNT